MNIKIITIKQILLTLGLLTCFFANAQTVVEKSADISVDETWNADTVKITGSITIANGATLTIDPGVFVEFQGYYNIDVQGSVLAQGSASDSIIFTVSDTTGFVNEEELGCWNGITYDNTDTGNDTSRFDYCSFSYSRGTENGGVFFIDNFNKIIIVNSSFINNQVNSSSSYNGGGAIYTYKSDFTITDCQFMRNGAFLDIQSFYGGAIKGTESDLNIINCSFLSNGNNITAGGALNLSNGVFNIVNCLFFNNPARLWGGGLYVGYHAITNIENSTFINNSVGSNGGGYYGHAIFGQSGDENEIQILNCIIWDNDPSKTDDFIYCSGGLINIDYSCVKGGLDNFINHGKPELKYSANNISIDPVFKNTGNTPYALSSSSPCINRGKTTWQIDSCFVETDIVGNERIFTAGTHAIIDMGAYEYQDNPDNYLYVQAVEDQHYVRRDSTFILQLSAYSNPSHSYNFIDKPDGMLFRNDSLIWEPTNSQLGINHDINLVVANGNLKDTFSFAVYALDSNEFIELTSVDTLWASDTIKVLNNLTVNTGSTLTISPGTYVEFQGAYGLNVNGALIANGEPDNRIQFTSKNASVDEGWSGINFDHWGRQSNPCSLNYCVFSYVFNDYGSAIESSSGDSILISNSIFNNNSCRYGVINCYSDSTTIIGNVLTNNIGRAITLVNSSSLLLNNTIVNNSAGVRIENYNSKTYKASIVNCIIQNNIDDYSNEANFDVSYYATYPTLIGNNIGGLSEYENGNIDEDPAFIETGEHPYQLYPFSPCVNMGNNAWVTDSVLVSYDVLGNARIFEGDSQGLVDMGAYECSTTETPKGINAFPGKARTDAVSFVIGDYAYVGMGNNGKEWFTDFYRYSDQTQEWSQIADYRAGGRTEPMFFVDGEKAYVGLGKIWDDNDSSYYYYENTEVYAPETNSWSAMPDNVLTPRSKTQSFIIDGKVYVGGGYYGNHGLYDVWVLDPATSTWEQKNNLPNDAVFWRTTVTIDDIPYLFIKGNFWNGATRTFIYKYDVNTDSYTEINVEYIWNPKHAFAYGDKALVPNHSGLLYAFNPTTKSRQSINQWLDSEYYYTCIKLNDTLYYGLGGGSFWSSTIDEDDQCSRSFKSCTPGPIDMSLSANTVSEDPEIGQLVGEVMVDYFEPWNDHEFSFVKSLIGADTLDNAKYSIDEDKLYLDYLPEVDDFIDSVLISASNTMNLSITKELYVYLNGAVGIELYEASKQAFKIYPNPVKDILTIQAINNDIINELSIISFTGAKVFKASNIMETQKQLNVSTFETGVYFILIKTSQSQYMKKLIIE